MKVNMNKKISFKIFKGYEIYGFIFVLLTISLLIGIYYYSSLSDRFLTDASGWIPFFIITVSLLFSPVFGLIWLIKSWHVKSILYNILRILMCLYLIFGSILITATTFEIISDTCLFGPGACVFPYSEENNLSI